MTVFSIISINYLARAIHLSDTNGVYFVMQPADIYLIDEPSAFLDSEQRIMASKVIKRFIFHTKKTAFIVEHNFIMATYLADRVIVFDGKASVECTANSPQSLLTGMNLFLSVRLNLTFSFFCSFHFCELFPLLCKEDKKPLL